MGILEAEDRAHTFVSHAFPEQIVDLGDVRMNYAETGDPALPPLLLIPGQSESWWGYEAAMRLLAENFHVFAVDMRGQGRSTWTPGRYTLNIFGNDLVRFIDTVIGAPTVVAGNSSGGVLATWMAAYAKPGQVRGSCLEDPPLFASQTRPDCGPSLRQAMGPLFESWYKWLGPQWSIGDWEGMKEALPKELPAVMQKGLQQMFDADLLYAAEPPQNVKEYDPEWGYSFYSGIADTGCDHARLLSDVRVPVLLTQHYHHIDADTGRLLGAVADVQITRAKQLIEDAGQKVTFRSFADAAHAMHTADPDTYARTLTEWAANLP